MIITLNNGKFHDRSSQTVHLQVLSALGIERLISYEGRTWLDQAIVGNLKVEDQCRGFGAELRRTLAMRQQWLAGKKLVERLPDGKVSPRPQMMAKLSEFETARLARELKAEFIPAAPGSRISGIYERAINTPTGKIAIIRSEDTVTLVPWKSALEPMRGRAFTGCLGPERVVWTRDRGGASPAR